MEGQEATEDLDSTVFFEELALCERLDKEEEQNKLDKESVVSKLWDAKQKWEEAITLLSKELSRDEEIQENAVDALFLLFRALVLDSRACYYNTKRNIPELIQTAMVNANKGISAHNLSSPLKHLKANVCVPIICCCMISHYTYLFEDYTTSLEHIGNALKGVSACRQQFGKAVPTWAKDSGVLEDDALSFLYCFKSELSMGLYVQQKDASKLSDVQRDAEKAIGYDPSNALARMNCGWVHQQRGNFLEAAKAYQSALQYLRRDDARKASCLYSYAWCYALGAFGPSIKVGELRKLVDAAQTVEKAQRRIFGEHDNLLKNHLEACLQKIRNMPDEAEFPALKPVLFESPEELGRIAMESAPEGTVATVMNDVAKEIKIDTKRCDCCGLSFSKLLRCASCKAAWYCSTTCQKKHWPAHKKMCTKGK